jgi:cbb3-type cytochrome oxidase subunit 1
MIERPVAARLTVSSKQSRIQNEEQQRMAVRLVKIAVVYLLIGLTLGVGMGMTHNFMFRSVHAHINLIGWASMALAALVFHVFPETARTRLATIWFWTYNISIPVGLGGLALVMAGQTWAEPALIAGQMGIWASGVMFAINIFWALRAKTAEDGTVPHSSVAAR